MTAQGEFINRAQYFINIRGVLVVSFVGHFIKEIIVFFCVLHGFI